MIKAPEASDHDCPEYLRIMRTHLIKATDKHNQYAGSRGRRYETRDAEIYKKYKSGISINTLGSEYGLTRNAIRAQGYYIKGKAQWVKSKQVK